MKKEEQTSIGEALPTSFVFHYDCGHGWLEVPLNALIKMNLSSQVSRHSRQKGELVYLEEGLDAPIFTRAYLKKIGKKGDYRFFNTLCIHVYDGYSSDIRNFQSYENKQQRTITLLHHSTQTKQ